ncbi:MAG: cupin domain-containing protein [Minwuiales bacterium]|nr:cupin domain-containing protein [Minwuiales bacterium]
MIEKTNIGDVQLFDNGHGDMFAAKLGRIGPMVGARQLGCMLTVVPPGKRAFPFHAHHANEEMFVILSGAGEYRMGEERTPLAEGDVVCAPAGGPETAHQIINTGDGDLRYLAISTMSQPEVVEYPDSGKFATISMVPEDGNYLAARILYVGRTENSLDYWEGEGGAAANEN